MKALVQRLLGDTCPDAVLAFVEGEAAPLQSAQAHSDVLGFGCYDAESRVALGIDLRILLARLVQGRGFPVIHYSRLVRLRLTQRN